MRSGAAGTGCARLRWVGWVCGYGAGSMVCAKHIWGVQRHAWRKARWLGCQGAPQTLSQQSCKVCRAHLPETTLHADD